MLRAVPLEMRVERPQASAIPQESQISRTSASFGNIRHIVECFRFDIDLTGIRQAFAAMESNAIAAYDSANDWAQKSYENRACRLLITISTNEIEWIEFCAALTNPFTKEELKIDLREYAKGFLVKNFHGSVTKVPFDGNDNGASLPSSRLTDNSYHVRLY